MRCPECGAIQTRVIDSRPCRNHTAVRRRRRCPSCGHRFTTFETCQHEARPRVMIRKRDGRLEPFDPQKLLAAIRRACLKLPISEQVLGEVVEKIEARLAQAGAHLSSSVVAEWVAAALRQIHPAAYLRYSMVQRKVADARGVAELLGETWGGATARDLGADGRDSARSRDD